MSRRLPASGLRGRAVSWCLAMENDSPRSNVLKKKENEEKEFEISKKKERKDSAAFGESDECPCGSARH